MWMALEADPAVYLRLDGQGRPECRRQMPEADPATWVREHVTKVTAETECGDCRWLAFCQGYFKQPAPAYSCDGVIRIFDRLHDAAEEMRADLSAAEPSGDGGEGNLENS